MTLTIATPTTTSITTDCHHNRHHNHRHHHQQAADCFVDASDVLVCEQEQQLEDNPTNYDNNTSPTKCSATDQELCKNLVETAGILRLALSNEFSHAMQLCEDRAPHELYAGLAHATLSFLRAGLTLEQADMQAAQVSVQNSMEVSQRWRRQVSTASMLARFLNPYSRHTNYDSFSDSQIHAELVNAESMLLHTLISFLADQSVICLVKGAFRIRACHQRYKECLQILAHRQNWGSPQAKQHFESGVRMGNGIFNLLMSYVPRRVLRFLEYVGFSGSRSTGIGELELAIELGDGLRSVLSALVILVYHSYVENLFGIGLYDEQKVSQLNDRFLATYHNSAFFLLFQGRYNQMVGNLDKAIDKFQACIDAQDDWKQFHAICHWEMMWCYAVRMDWPKAAHYANLLRAHSKWSPASYTYQYASFLYEQLLLDLRREVVSKNSAEFQRRMDEIRELMESVPSLRIRYAGKTIPADKFAIERSMKFCRQNNRLAMPSMEFLYIWNIFCILKNNQKQVEEILKFIESERLRLIEEASSSSPTKQENHQEEQEEDDEHHHKQQQQDTLEEDLCLVDLLAGMCKRYLNNEEGAEQAFKQVIANEDKIKVKQERFLLPYASMELTLLKLDQRQYDEARELVKQTRSQYTGYLMESIVHFRLHAASRLISYAQLDNSTRSNSLVGDEDDDDDDEVVHHTIPEQIIDEPNGTTTTTTTTTTIRTKN